MGRSGCEAAERVRSGAAAAVVVSALLAWVGAASGQITAEEVLADLRISDAEKARVLAGEFVSRDLPPASERDLSVSIAFLARKPPAQLSDAMLSGELATDTDSRGAGTIDGGGTLADFAAVPMPSDVAQAFLNAQPGEALNLSEAEIAAFTALRAGAAPVQAVQAELQRMLLGRYQAYRTDGLAGIAPYARAGGVRIDVGGELRKASDATAALKKFMPSFRAVLLDSPGATVPGLQQTFRWVADEVDGALTYALMQILAAPDGDARVVAQREYYVSTGYNAEQAVAAFLPVQQGTLVLYVNHTFTDQIAGFGGAMKRSIGERMMKQQLEALFARQRGQ